MPCAVSPGYKDELMYLWFSGAKCFKWKFHITLCNWEDFLLKENQMFIAF